ncbi:lysozyme inhibitor LprI family protein [Deinococcus ruber]|uniref:Lysozyme inhibitor LprI-like N-terminal domain-containing protein n=1 Tax=Deinococcus ruber TaxID=1848197 RepID=A0A918F9X5_9DEIO|nr:lysozyme inhibitor LprI family protein [Deinococcus ruber]GGR14523.1 hypothetical protein GCM10008957_29160 [Deinococcus ruber]
MQRMLRNFTAAVLVAAGMTAGGTAQAQNNCNTPGNSFEDVYCLSKVFVKADDDLNVAYQKLLKRLSPRAQATLRRTQRAWVSARNTDCTATDSKMGDIIYIGCAVDRTTARTNFLNDRYRECISSGCQPAKLNE